MGRERRKKLFRDKSTMWSFTINTIGMTKFRGIIFRYFWFDDLIETYFGINSLTSYKNLTSVTIGKKKSLHDVVFQNKKRRSSSLPAHVTKMELFLP